MRAVPGVAAGSTQIVIEEVRFAPDSPVEGGVMCELVSKGSVIAGSDEFLESIKKGVETPAKISGIPSSGFDVFQIAPLKGPRRPSLSHRRDLMFFKLPP